MTAMAGARRRTEPAAFVAANLSFIAAAVHLWAMPVATADWWGYGAFFLGAALAQAALAAALLFRPGPAVYQAGIWTTVIVLATYGLTRVAGIPVGPLAGVVEDPGTIDMATAAAEVALIVALVSLLEGRARALTIDALLLLGAAGWAGRLWLL